MKFRNMLHLYAFVMSFEEKHYGLRNAHSSPIHLVVVVVRSRRLRRRTRRRHLRPTPLPPPPTLPPTPRGPLSILCLAGRACLSLLTSPSSQKDFANKIDRGAKGVINPIVLGQADLGLAQVLALYHDLKSEAFRSHEVNVIFWPKDVLEGAIPLFG